MGTCGDQCATKYNITRKDQDDFAAESYKRAIKAWEDGFYKESVVPVEIKSKKETAVVDHDEDVAKFRGEEALRSLPPAFGKDSTITAGNASKINDGAAAMVVFDDDRKKALSLKPAARILGHANVAMESDWFTIAPIYAIKKLCERLRLKLSDVDVFEINEAFAIVAVVAIRELGLDPQKVNVAGGAVAIGHPIGASGARIVTNVVQALQRRNKRVGIAAICIGGGEATAIALERV
jgi:acetyl-CoA C-acetyltransferase